MYYKKKNLTLYYIVDYIYINDNWEIMAAS